ncbi:MAG: wax ester/triacylglycerol synthase family O-acyltransferase [Azonexus sp.]
MKHLSGIDSLFLTMEHGNQIMQVAALGIYDPSTAPGGELRFKSVLNFFDTRMKQIKVFRRRLVEAPWGLDRPHWVDDDDVDIEYHVRHIALPQPGDWRQLMIQVARLHSRSLDKSKPLWEAYIIEGLDNIQGIAPGSFALYIKFHHAAVDGEAGVEILRAIHSLSPLPDQGDGVRPAAIIAERDPTSLELVARTVGHRTRQLFGGSWLLAGLGKRAVLGGVNLVTSGKALDLGRQIVSGRLGVAGVAAEIVRPYSQNLNLPPRTRFSGRISAHRVVDAVGYSLADCKKIREQVEAVTINDIFMAAAGGALRKYLELKGELPQASLNALMPLSTRGEHTGRDESNQVGMAAVQLGTDIADPRERLLAVHRASNRGKSLSAAVGNDLPARLVDIMPAVVVEQIARSALMPLVNVTVSNVRGPDRPLYMAGAKLQMFMPLSIIVDGIGLNLTGLSYNGTLWVCFVSCRKMLPDPAVFVNCLTESFDELLAAAGRKKLVDAEVKPAARRPRRTAAPAPAPEKKTGRRKAAPAKDARTKPVVRKSAVK